MISGAVGETTELTLTFLTPLCLHCCDDSIFISCCFLVLISLMHSLTFEELLPFFLYILTPALWLLMVSCFCDNSCACSLTHCHFLFSLLRFLPSSPFLTFPWNFNISAPPAWLTRTYSPVLVSLFSFDPRPLAPVCALLTSASCPPHPTTHLASLPPPPPHMLP